MVFDEIPSQRLEATVIGRYPNGADDGDALALHHAANRASQFAASVIVIPLRNSSCRRL